MSYIRLTKVIKDNNDREYVVCVHYGTETCRIHSENQNCARCPMMSAIYNQLYEFEEIVSDAEDDGEEN